MRFFIALILEITSLRRENEKGATGFAPGACSRGFFFDHTLCDLFDAAIEAFGGQQAEPYGDEAQHDRKTDIEQCLAGLASPEEVHCLQAE